MAEKRHTVELELTDQEFEVLYQSLQHGDVEAQIAGYRLVANVGDSPIHREYFIETRERLAEEIHDQW